MMALRSNDNAAPAGKDTLTLLRAINGQRMTKLWKADGTVDGYEDARNFTVKVARVESIQGIFRLLSHIETESSVCVIRGEFVGESAAQTILPPEYPGHYRRKNALFRDQALHAVMLDIDGFSPPAGIDPVTQPVAAINAYVTANLPTCFHGVTYCWQLSSSAGMAKHRDVLKAHVWFWLDTPYTSGEMKAWAKSIGTVIDSSVFQKVQVHYTARPVFEDAAMDTVPVRIGLEDGWMADSVDLVLDDNIKALAAHSRGDDDDYIDLVDPKTKKGVIGAFCRAFTIEHVIAKWLPEVFAFDDDGGRRLTYLKGGGAKGGAFITPDREYVVNKHNTDPLDNRATNKFDLVRVHCFGHLDIGADVLLLADVTGRPSYEAAIAMMRELPEVRSELNDVKQKALDEWLQRIAACDDAHDLQTLAEQEIAADVSLTAVDKAVIESLLVKSFRSLDAPLTTKTVRALLCKKRKHSSGKNDDGWCTNYVWCNAEDCFVDIETQQQVTMQSFNASFGREVKGTWVTAEGVQMSASHVALHEIQIPVVSRRMYLPWADTFFDYDGMKHLNSYRPSSVPAAKPKSEWGEEDAKAVAMFEAHVGLLLNPPEVKMLLDWMAYCVQKPGDKIKWSVLIKGIQGDGKSYIGEVLRSVMGVANVGTVSPKVLNTDFNGWAEGHCVCLLEELRMAGHNRHDVLNALKELHTNDIVTIHKKGQDSYPVCNTQNYLAFTNFADALPIDMGERRWGIAFSKIQDVEELNEMGMNTQYFDALFAQLSNHVGALRTYFLSRDISGFHAKGRAPDTDAKDAMVAIASHDEDDAVREIIETGIVGVSKHVVSTAHLTNHLTMEHPDIEVPKGKGVATILTRLGFHKVAKLVKWKGQPNRVWVRRLSVTKDPAKVRELLDNTCKDGFSEQADEACPF